MPELLATVVVGPFWILEPCQVRCALCLHSRLSIAVISIQPTPTQSALSHAMLQCLKKLPLHLVVLLHEGAVVVVNVVVVMVVVDGDGWQNRNYSQSNYARQMRVGSGLKKVVKKVV